MQIYRRRVLIMAMGMLGAVSAGCGSSTAPTPTQYFSFKYVITPPGTGSTTDALVLPISESSTICDRGNKKISLFGVQGSASVAMVLTGTATAPFQKSLNIDYHTVDSARVDFSLPTVFDAMGVGRNSMALTTINQAEGLLCSFDVPTADYFAAMDGAFTCTSSQTGMPQRLDLTEGRIVATPCGASP